MPIQMMLEECLLICRHYKSLQWHINTVRPTGSEIKAMDGLARRHPRPKSRGANNTRPQQSVCPDKQKTECTACGTVHQVGECPAVLSVCFKCNKQGHFSRLCQSTTINQPSFNRNTRGSWCGKGIDNNRGGKGHGFKCAAYEAKTSDTLKPIIDATNHEVDVKLLQAYGMVPTEGSELKHRKVK